jgi:hypothetical protein
LHFKFVRGRPFAEKCVDRWQKHMELQTGHLRDFTKNNLILSVRKEKGSKDACLLKNTT